MKHLIAAAGLAALTGAPALADCYSVAEGGEQAVILDGYVLTDVTAAPGLMDPPPLTEGAVGLMCDRDTIVPDANDFEVLYHAPLYIRAGEGDATTILALGYADGQYVVQLPQGSINDEERAAIIAALEGFNEGEAALQAYRAAQAEADEEG